MCASCPKTISVQLNQTSGSDNSKLPVYVAKAPGQNFNLIFFTKGSFVKLVRTFKDEISRLRLTSKDK